MHIILENTVSHMVPYRKAVTAFCHDRPIIVFITLCDPAVALSVAYRQYIQKAELSVATRHQEFACHVTAKARAVTAFCHDRPIIVFITLCDPAVALSVAYRQYIQRRNCQRRPAVRTLLVTLLQKARAVTAFCHDRPIIFFIALCDPAVALSVAYRQYIQRRNCQRRPAALAVADFYNIDINVLEPPCASIIIVLFGTAHIYVNRDRSCHHTLACICRYSIAVADVVVLTDNVQL